ncbi:hypothetical protein CRV15_33985 (plasmid) [Streptomyces clavuligerus]|uniref:Uncharacterized protein n=1 Tax=Streptomyces clavuligerus TaxID=1901 RepID=B5GYP7_STRCL|nr:hypothetical protein D1794_29905 [Streptomyces clavuligerus]AXU17450.1 hypothetical protein D1794_33270 [Streptomyces clavuligerus]EDY51443.1 hypothetical protein SSCG_04648 [Streptomyces clavuligerus]EFG04695.1 Hypothetical protein SCLAV_p1209 [Streptomyces clavuligerus]QCS10546.1 hypothetical protein CRV15_33985 [Streptomyces clavuligerus]
MAGVAGRGAAAVPSRRPEGRPSSMRYRPSHLLDKAWGFRASACHRGGRLRPQRPASTPRR